MYRPEVRKAEREKKEAHKEMWEKSREGVGGLRGGGKLFLKREHEFL